MNSSAGQKAYIVTGPTSGIGREAAFELAKHGTAILVGRNREKLNQIQKAIEDKGGDAVNMVCDVSDIVSVRRAAAQIVALGLPIVGVLNNAGVVEQQPTRSAQNWDTTFATNHLGPFVLTEALAPHLPDGANILTVVSAVEDPERKPARIVGMRGARYISAEASSRDEWEPGGSKLPGADAYATSKQCALAAVMEFAREMPRLRFIAAEPGITPGTGLGRANFFVRQLFGIITLFPPFAQYRSTPKQAARVIAAIITDQSVKSGTYCDEKGRPMQGSVTVRNPKFRARVMAETRTLLSTISH